MLRTAFTVLALSVSCAVLAEVTEEEVNLSEVNTDFSDFFQKIPAHILEGDDVVKTAESNEGKK